MSAAELRIPPHTLRARVGELGAEITAAYRGTRPLLVTVLRGGVFFLADLVRHVRLDVEVDFLALSRYERGGMVRIVKDLEGDIGGRHVLLVEDIVDTGLTLAFLLRVLAARAPASLRICALLDRSVRRIAELPLDFVGFEVGDEFLVGYGLDLDGRLRNLPGIIAVHDRQALRAGPEAVAARILGNAAPPSHPGGS